MVKWFIELALPGYYMYSTLSFTYPHYDSTNLIGIISEAHVETFIGIENISQKKFLGSKYDSDVILEDGAGLQVWLKGVASEL